MSQEQPRTERSETSLLEHSDALVNLLNNFVSKDSISSQHVLRRLEYLYNRLSDFLGGSEDWEPPDSKASVSPKEEEEESPTKEIADLMYKCSLCKSHVQIYNLDTELSMSIHCQEEVHERAVQVQRIRELNDQSLRYVSYTGGTNKFHCWLCDLSMTSDESVQQHVRGAAHQRKLASQRTGKQVACNSKGQYWCNVCNLPVGDALEHQRSDAHSQKLSQEPDKFWLKIPEAFRCHKKYFSNLGETMLCCNVCVDNIPRTQINVLSHIRGKKHTGALEGDF